MTTQQLDAIRDAIGRLEAASLELDALEAGPPPGDAAINRAVAAWSAAMQDLDALLSLAGYDSARLGGRTFTVHRPADEDALASVYGGIIAVASRTLDLDAPAAVLVN
jgi:hypothetical protein